MSVQSQIDRLNTIKQRIRTNLVAQGITVPDDTKLEAMAEQILSVAGEDGQRGTGLLSVTTAPSSYTTAVGGITPKYRMAISTIKTQAGVTEVLLGDTIRYSYYQYPVAYLDASYAYFTTRVSIRGTTGANGKDYSFDPTVYGLPVLELTGDISPIAVSKDNKVTLSYVYGERSGSCTLKGQGATSYAKAQALGDKGKYNYTINFDTAFEAKDGWGEQNKYCLKANWNDHTHARNIVSARLWGLMSQSRSNVPNQLSTLPNCGAIDGFPIVIMLNGEFHGLYTFNIPKDKWLFGMGSGAKEAIISADDSTHNDSAFKEETLLDGDSMELEYAPDENDTEWVKESMNTLINACINSWGGDLDTTVAQYLNWESAIDYYILTVLLESGPDMINKNWLIVTFDGVKWYFSPYDMDATYGLIWDASGMKRPVSGTTFEQCADSNRVFELIKRFKTDTLKARYRKLRENTLSESRICQYVENFAWAIPSVMYMEDVKRWPAMTHGSAVSTIDQICRWVRQRLETMDAWIDALPAQETPVEPEKPVEMVNQVPVSTDTDGSIYNGTGYKDNTRLSSSGGVSGTAQNGSVVTGFIPFKNTDVIRMKGAEWLNMTAEHGGHFYFSLYDSNKTFITGGYVNSEAYDSYSSQLSAVYDDTTEVTTFSIINPTDNTGNFRKAAQSAAYFRINAYGKGADMIVTVNQEITT